MKNSIWLYGLIVLLLYAIGPNYILSGPLQGKHKSVLARINSGGGGQTFLVNQNFETGTTGYDNGETWTESTVGGSVVDPAYSTSPAPLLGTQSLYLGGTAANEVASTYTTFADQSAVSIFMLHEAVTLGTDSFQEISIMNDSTLLARIRMGNGTDIRMYHGTDDSGWLSVGYAINTLYYIWVDYAPGTGSNGTMTLYFSTSGTKGSATATLSAGTSTLDANRIMLVRAYSQVLLFDKVLVSATTIGDQ